MIYNMSFEELKRETENSDNELAKLLLKNFEDFEDKRVDVSTKEFDKIVAVVNDTLSCCVVELLQEIINGKASKKSIKSAVITFDENYENNILMSEFAEMLVKFKDEIIDSLS